MRCSKLVMSLHNITDTKPKLTVAFKKLLPLAEKWKIIGILIGLETHILENIKKDEGGVQDCLGKMLSEWLKMADPPPTWKDIIDAVQTVDPSKAEEIKEYLED